MFTVYVLVSTSTGKLYVGQTQDLPRRLSEHQTGLAHYTRGRGPWSLVLTEYYPTRAQAMRREKSLKTGQGRHYIREMLTAGAGPPQAD
jgi:putative endonuclease